MKKGKQDAICTLLVTKFGTSADSVQAQVHSINDLQMLDQVLRKVVSTKSFEDVRVIIKESAKT